MLRGIKRLLRNKINLYNNLSTLFYIFAAIGYWTYMPKYLETIFMQTAASASAISGIVSIAFQATGLLISGALISKYQPSARTLALWNVVIGFAYVLVKISFTQMGCNPGELVHRDIYSPNINNPGEFGSSSTSDNHLQVQINSAGAAAPKSEWNLTLPCNEDCGCRVNKILPVCHKELNHVYYSACHAGCMSFEGSIGTNCSCLPSLTDTVSLGTCSEDCYKSFILFLAVNAFIKLLDSSGRIGNMLVGYRCVDPKDKSLAIGLSIFILSIFSMLPAPILFGAIFDNVCLVWGTKCGGRGNCWLYDGEKLRYIFNLAAAAFTFIGAFFDLLVWYYVKDLDLYDEEKNIQNKKDKEKGKHDQIVSKE